MAKDPYTAVEAAEMLGTDARTLRRFLRRDVTYRSAGAGGRYQFTDRDIPTLKKRFNAWQNKNQARRVVDRVDPEDYSIEIVIPRMTPELRREIREQELRLDEKLRAAGLHLSQLNREDWRANPNVR